jgi:hypothetical protein
VARDDLLTPERLAQLQNDFAKSKTRKMNRLHGVWRKLADAYRLADADFFDYYDYIVDTASQAAVSVNPETYLKSLDGRTAHLNVFLRKFVALLAFTEPEYMAENLRPGDEPFAWLLERAFKSLSEEIKFPRVLKRMLSEAGMTGTAVVNTGYRSEFVWAETPLAAARPPEETGDDDFEDALPKPVTTEHTWELIGEHPNARVLRSYDVFFDSAARTLEEIRIIYERSSRIVRDVQLDERFKPAAREKAGATRSDSQDSGFHDGEDTDGDFRRVDVIQALHLESKKFCVFGEGIDTPYKDWTPLDLPVQNPYHIFQPIPDRESCWGMPYLLLMYSQTQARNTISERIVDSVARHGKKLILFGNDVSDETVNFVNTGQDGQSFRDPNLNSEQLQKAKIEIEFGTVNPDVMMLRNMIDNDMNAMSGLSDPTIGVYRNVEQTATEVQNRTQGQVVTLDDMQQEYEWIADDIGASLFKIMLAFWEKENLVKYVGEDPRIYFWTRIEAQDLIDNFRLKIRVGSTQRVNPDVRRKHMIEATDRVIKLEQAIVMQKQNMAMGIPPTANLEEYLRALVEEIDPRLGDKILNRRDPAALVDRLVSQKLAWPVNVSPDLLNLLGQTNPTLAAALGWQGPPLPAPAAPGGAPMMPGGPAGQPAMPNVVPFEVANGVPAPQGVNQLGQMPGERPAMPMGRMLSEAMGGMGG